MRGTISYGVKQDEMLYMSNIVNVRALGAVGDGIINDARAIQKAFDFLKNSGGTILFPVGTYLITSQVFFYSNQKIVFEKGAKLLQGNAMDNLMMNYSTSDIGAYDATDNVEIVGGIFDGGSFTTNNTLLGVCHAKNIKITDCTFVNAYGSWHNLEINACKNVTIDGCRFEGSRKTSSNGCLIQIDNFTSTATWPWGNGLVDNTVSQLVEIRACHFYDSPQAPAIGNHSPAISNTIRIHDNVFENVTTTRGAINFVNATNVDVYNNTFIDCTTGVIVGTADGTNLVHNNRFVGVSTVADESCNADSNMVNGTLVTDDNYVTPDDLKSLAYKDVISESDLDESLLEKLNSAGEGTSSGSTSALPEVSTDDDGKVMTVVEGAWSAQTLSVDYSVNDQDTPGYVANRTHWKEGSEELLDIQWDSNTEGRASIDLVDGVIFYKVSDSIITDEELLACTLVHSAISEHANAADLSDQLMAIGTSTALNAYILILRDPEEFSEIMTEMAGYEIAASETGIYFGLQTDFGYITRLYSNTVTVGTVVYHKLPVEYLPDDLKSLAYKDVISESDLDASLTEKLNNTGGASVQADWDETDTTSPAYIKNKPIISGDGSVSVQSNWEQTDESQPDFIKNKPFGLIVTEKAILSETALDLAYNSDFGAFVLAVSEPEYTFEAGQDYKVVWDGNEYIRTAFEFVAADGAECIAVGNPLAAGMENNGDVFCIVYDKTNNSLLYASLEQASSHAVAIYQDSIDIDKLDAEYLPEEVATKTYVQEEISKIGASALPEVTSSDAGKFLRVSADGAWVAESIQNAEGASF